MPKRPNSKAKPKAKRYRWTQETAAERFNALPIDKQKDYAQAFIRIRRGEASVRAAAKAMQVDRENLTAYVRAFGDVEAKPGRPIRIKRDNRPVSFKVITPSGEVLIDATGEDAAIAKAHREALNQAKKLRDRSKLLAWRGKFIIDRNGVKHPFLTDLDRFFELFPPDEFNPASIYA